MSHILNVGWLSKERGYAGHSDLTFGVNEGHTEAFARLVEQTDRHPNELLRDAIKELLEKYESAAGRHIPQETAEGQKSSIRADFHNSSEI